MDLWRSRFNVSRSPRKTTGSPCKLEGVLKIGRFLLQTACHTNPHHPTKFGQAHYPGCELAGQCVGINLVSQK